MKRYLKYLIAVLVAATLGYLAYHYRQELLGLLEQLKEKSLELKDRFCTCRDERGDFEDL